MVKQGNVNQSNKCLIYTYLSRVKSVTRKHVKSLHLLIVPTCLVCNMTFKSKTVTNNHMLNHINRLKFRLNLPTAAAWHFPTAVVIGSPNLLSLLRLILRTPLVSASVHQLNDSLHQLPAGRPSYSSLFHFYDIDGVLEWQIRSVAMSDCCWCPAAAGHTKVFTSQLVSLSLCLNAWCLTVYA